MAVRASIVVKSGLMRVGQKQMDRFSLVIKFTLLSWLTLGKTEFIHTLQKKQMSVIFFFFLRQTYLCKWLRTYLKTS